MSSTRGKRVALVAATVTLGVLLTAAVVGRQWFVEEYYIRQLGSREAATRIAAVGALGEMKSVRAVPHLVRVLEQSKAEAERGGQPLSQRVRPRLGVAMISNPVDATFIVIPPAAFAIHKIGPAALPELLRAEAGSTCRREIGLIIEALANSEIRVEMSDEG